MVTSTRDPLSCSNTPSVYESRTHLERRAQLSARANAVKRNFFVRQSVQSIRSEIHDPAEGDVMRPAFPAPAGFRVEVAPEPSGEPHAPVRVVHPDPPLTVTLTPIGSVPGGWYELELRFSPEGTIDCLAQFVHANGRVIWLRLPVIARNEFL